jgi:hypothetical protein
MDPKRRGTGKAFTSVATEGVAHAALRRGPVHELSAEEEKVMRMRLGAALPRTGQLEWTDSELGEDQLIELKALQIEAWTKWKAHLSATRVGRTAEDADRRTAERTLPSPEPSRTKEKIVRALRKKA